MKIILKVIVRFFLSLWIIPKNLLLYRLGCKHCPSSEIVQNLCDKGFHVFSEKIDEEDIQKLIDVYYKMAEKIPIEDSGQDFGRIYMPHLKSELVQKYVNKFLPIAAKYFDDKNMQVELSLFQKSVVQKEVNNIPGGEYHMDDNKKNVKFFIYLTDVFESNRPFTLSPSTHGPRNFSEIYRWIGWEITAKRKFLYYKCLPSWAPNPIKVLGKKGTVFCADTTILHKAEALKKDERLVLVISFAEKRLDPYKFLSSNTHYADINKYV